MSYRAREDAHRSYRRNDAALRPVSGSPPCGRKESGDDGRGTRCGCGCHRRGGCGCAAIVESADQAAKQSVKIWSIGVLAWWSGWWVSGVMRRQFAVCFYQLPLPRHWRRTSCGSPTPPSPATPRALLTLLNALASSRNRDSASNSALLNADVDLDMRAPVAALQAMAHGVKLTFLLSQSNTLEYDVVTRPEIKDIKQLKGKKVGIIRFGGISELMVRYLFQKLGLDADKDIGIVQVGQARFVALEKGAIDATVFASAESAYAKRNGFRILDMPTLPFFGSTIVASPAVAAKRTDVMTRFMKGYLDGVRFFLNEPERSRQFLADLLRTKDRDMIELAYKNHPQHQMGRKPYPDMNAVKATLDIMSPRDPLVKKLKAEELFTLSYLKQLDQSGYIDQLYQSDRKEHS